MRVRESRRLAGRPRPFCCSGISPGHCRHRNSRRFGTRPGCAAPEAPTIGPVLCDGKPLAAERARQRPQTRVPAREGYNSPGSKRSGGAAPVNRRPPASYGRALQRRSGSRRHDSRIRSDRVARAARVNAIIGRNPIIGLSATGAAFPCLNNSNLPCASQADLRRHGHSRRHGLCGRPQAFTPAADETARS